MNGETIISALQKNAGGVQMGTAFLCCDESGANGTYKKILLAQKDDDTCLTKVFSGKWARAIENKFIEAMKPYEDLCLDYPVQNALTSVMRRAAKTQKNTDFMSLWAGQRVYLSRSVSASELIMQLNQEVMQSSNN